LAEAVCEKRIYTEKDILVRPALRDLAERACRAWRGDTGVIGAFKRELRKGGHLDDRKAAQALTAMSAELRQGCPDLAPSRRRRERRQDGAHRKAAGAQPMATGADGCGHKRWKLGATTREGTSETCAECGATRVTRSPAWL
jgi:hypothetical protein